MSFVGLIAAAAQSWFYGNVIVIKFVQGFRFFSFIPVAYYFQKTIDFNQIDTSKLLDFFTTDETEQEIKNIKAVQSEEKRADKFQKEIDEAQAKIDAGIGNEEYLQGLIDKRQAQIDQINAEIGLDNVDALAERISTLQGTADLAEGKENAESK